MSYTVTANKMRPAVFDELAGQNFVVTSLQKSVESGKIAHAYLFSGPRGVGKTSAARILAKAINCEKAPAKNPCCQCSSCVEISMGTSLDVIEIDGASNTSVNDIREIKDEVLFAPVNSKYKVYIIDEVHMLSNSAFNALLKTIEEPPPYIVFIFATTEVHKVPATIRSRCQHFNFKLIHIDVIKELLRKICKENNIKAADDVLFWIAKEATGSLRDAYTLFDKIAAFSGDTISLDIIKEKMGLAGFDKINKLAECFADSNAEEALWLINDILNSGVAVEQFVSELTEYLRNVLLIKNNVVRESLLGYPVSAFSKKFIDSFSVFQIEQSLALVLQLYRDIRYSLSQRFELELLVARLASIKNFLSRQELLEEIKKLKDDFETEPSAVPSPVPPAENRQDEHEKKIGMADLKNEVTPAVKKRNMVLASALGKTEEWEEKEDVIVIPAEDGLLADSLNKSVSDIEEEIKKITGVAYKVEIKHIPKQVSEEETFSEEENIQVDMIKKVFKGEVIKKKRENDEF